MATHPPLRPKDAATLIALRRDGGALRVLMGRRSDAHAFMPGMVVFPGGRVDRYDRLAPAADAVHPEVEARLVAAMRGRPSPGRARALALAALREAYEETGLILGRPGTPGRPVRDPAWRAFLAHGRLPSLAPLRLVAQAITPPGRVRRFDARFFAAFAEEGALEVEAPHRELLAPAWLTFEETFQHPLPRITKLVLAHLRDRLAADPALSPGGPILFSEMRHGRYRTALL
ncbi:MAG TPA: NUDIX hydrolase [Afifellaceae bacterium]|nr:NUDIX hydrolase [Afifellaceae bacterium]